MNRKASTADSVGVSNKKATEQVRQKKGRIGSVDVAKGVGILSIVIGHLANSETVNALVFQYHVPIFFIVAGYFLSTSKPFGVFVRQKAKRLLLPYAFTCAAICVVMACFRIATGESNPPTLYGGFSDILIASLWGASAPIGSLIVKPYIGAIWFLEALFVALVEVRLCIDLAHGKKWITPIIVVGLFLVSVATRGIFWMPFNLQSGFCAGLWVYVGYLAKLNGLLEHRYNPVVLALSVIVVAFCWATNTVVYLNEAYAGPYCLGAVTTLFACYLLLKVSDVIDGRGGLGSKVLRFYGVNSLVILCVHLTLMNCGFGHLFAPVALLGIPHLTELVNICAQVAIATLCVFLFRKTPFVKSIFF